MMGPLLAELDRWRDAGRTAALWWRDDDAVEPTPALDRLLGLADSYRAPLLLAAIPDGATPALAGRLAGEGLLSVAQHGLAHRNHAPAGEKAAEFGAHRDEEAMLRELGEGRERMRAIFGDAALPALVPPWNRIAPGLAARLAEEGFTALSTFAGPLRRENGVAILDTHVDPIDWRGTRGCRDHAVLAGDLVAALEGSRRENSGPVGLLTHHLVHDEAVWDFVAAVLEATSGHPAARWLPFGEAAGIRPR